MFGLSDDVKFWGFVVLAVCTAIYLLMQLRAGAPVWFIIAAAAAMALFFWGEMFPMPLDRRWGPHW